MRLLAFVLMMSGATSAWAEGVPPMILVPVAVYATSNGSLPPPYHWEWSASLFGDGMIEVTYCKGYSEGPPGCAIETGNVAELDQIRAIEQAARDSGLLTRAAVEANPPMVGGGTTHGWVSVDGQEAILISQPRDSDKRRVERVLDAIAAAIPSDLVAKAEARALAPAED